MTLCCAENGSCWKRAVVKSDHVQTHDDVLWYVSRAHGYVTAVPKHLLPAVLAPFRRYGHPGAARTTLLIKRKVPLPDTQEGHPCLCPVLQVPADEACPQCAASLEFPLEFYGRETPSRWTSSATGTDSSWSTVHPIIRCHRRDPRVTVPPHACSAALGQVRPRKRVEGDTEPLAMAHVSKTPQPRPHQPLTHERYKRLRG